MTYAVFMDGWDRGTVARMWSSQVGLTVNETAGRRETRCLERVYGPATDDWLRSVIFSASSCVTLGFALYIPSGQQSLEIRLGYNWDRQISLVISNFGLHWLINAGGSTLWNGGEALTLDDWNYIELIVFCDPAGSYELRVNSDVRAYVDNTNTQGISGQLINSLYFSWAGAGNTGCLIDDLYFAYGDELVAFGDSRVDTLPLVANRTPQQWAPNPSTPTADIYTLLNQEEGSINAVSTGQLAMYKPANLEIGVNRVWATQTVTRAGKTDAGTARIQIEFREGTTLVDGPEFGLSTSRKTYWQGYAKNPVTDAAWTVADVNNAEIGVKAGTL